MDRERRKGIFPGYVLIIWGALATTSIAGQTTNLSGHYRGTATDGNGKQTSATIELTDRGDDLSGEIRTIYGDYSITSGKWEKGIATLSFDAGGAAGTMTLTIAGDVASGSYVVSGEKGSARFTRTSAQPLQVGGKAEFATPIMFLGVYHMSNPGLDAADVLADDVLQPARQTQLGDLVERLAGLRPTKIAIEEQYGEEVWKDRYRRYLTGTYTLGNNEVEQIGFRLAKKLGLSRVYPVDFRMYMNGLTPSEIEQPLHTDPSPPTAQKEQIELSGEDKLLRSLTIVEYLAHINQPDLIGKGQGQYMSMLLPAKDDPAIYKNADLLANWYRRNLRIFSNINRITQPDDRILVIFGVGHMALLQEFASQSPEYQLIPVEPFLQH